MGSGGFDRNFGFNYVQTEPDKKRKTRKRSKSTMIKPGLYISELTMVEVLYSQSYLTKYEVFWPEGSMCVVSHDSLEWLLQGTEYLGEV